ncbi:MAG: hypothetical protein ABSE43_18270, partial [Steroidobacteraceae bacterium]
MLGLKRLETPVGRLALPEGIETLGLLRVDFPAQPAMNMFREPPLEIVAVSKCTVRNDDRTFCIIESMAAEVIEQLILTRTLREFGASQSDFWSGYLSIDQQIWL